MNIAPVKVLLRTLAAAAVVLMLVGYIGWLRRDNARLRERTATSVQVMSPDQVRRLVKEETGQIVTEIGGLKETLFRFQDEFGRRSFGRTVEGKPGPVGSQGPPGPPGKPAVPVPGVPDTSAPPPGPAKPLVPAEETPKAREEATERAYLFFRPGSLLDCDAGFGPNVVELLRRPGGALVSTASCVWRITDVFNLPDVQVRVAPSRWKVTLGFDLSERKVGAGVAYEAVRFWRLSLDAVVIGTPSFHAGVGLSYEVVKDWTTGPALLYDVNRSQFEPWWLVARRF